MMIEEQEFSQKEKFEIENRLSKVRAIMNETIPKLSTDFFSRTGKDKKDTKIGRVYYAGGTLCINVSCGDDKGLIMLNISDETITITSEGNTTRQLMSIQSLWFAFYIYKEVKGVHRKYYQDCYKNSCIRHLYSILMNKRKAGDSMSEIEDCIMYHAISVADNFDFDKVMDEILK